jgi:hypothetical protein
MNKYTNAELVDFLFMAQSAMDTQFQYWITVTFGALAAAFVIGGRLTLPTRLWAGALYLLASTVLALRFLSAAGTVSNIQSSLEQVDAAVLWSFGLQIPVLRVPLLVLGTASALFFLIRPQAARLREEVTNGDGRAAGA